MQLTIVLTDKEYDDFLCWKYRYGNLLNELMYIISLLNNVNDQNDTHLLHAISSLRTVVERYK